jgi:hypothetical protein
MDLFADPIERDPVSPFVKRIPTVSTAGRAILLD